MDHRRTAVFGVLVCLASWFALATAAGNVGLQQSVGRYSLDPVGFLMMYPLAVAVCLGAAFAVAFMFARGTHAPKAFALHGAVAVLLGDVVASFVAAPVLIGELEIGDGPIVFLAISFFGLQVVAAWAGVRLGAGGERRFASAADTDSR